MTLQPAVLCNIPAAGSVLYTETLLHPTQEDSMLKRIGLIALMAVALPLAALASNWIHVEVTEDGGETMVKAQFPVSMVEVALGIAEDEIAESGALRLDDADITVEELRAMWIELREAGDAEFVNIKETSGEHVSVYRKGDFVHVDVEDRSSYSDREEKVNIKVPVSVIDKLFEGEGEELNLRAALAELERAAHGQVISVMDGDTEVKVWIDDEVRK